MEAADEQYRRPSPHVSSLYECTTLPASCLPLPSPHMGTTLDLHTLLSPMVFLFAGLDITLPSCYLTLVVESLGI
jgi:hypothetical protein